MNYCENLVWSDAANFYLFGSLWMPLLTLQEAVAMYINSENHTSSEKVGASWHGAVFQHVASCKLCINEERMKKDVIRMDF